MTQPIHPILERVAAVINNELMKRSNHILESGLSQSLARAAIQALLEPDEGMVEAVNETDFDVYWNYWQEGIPAGPRAIYQAMLKPLLGDEG